MSLLSIHEAPGTSGHINDEFIRDSQKTFRALFDIGDDEIYVALNCGIVIYGVHPTDLRQRVLDIKTELVKANVTNPATNGLANLWQVDVTYGAWDFWNKALDGNPLNVPIRLRVDFTLVEVAAFIDVNGNPIVNAAGDWYDPGLSRDDVQCTITVLRNEAPSSVNIATLAAISNTLNLATWNGFDPLTVRLMPLKLPEVIYNPVINSFYYPMEYNFAVNFNTWVKQIWNSGFRQLDVNGNLVPILINGQPVTTPYPLDESGHAIGVPMFTESTGNILYQRTHSTGGQPPKLGTGTAGTSNYVINAYLLNYSSDFTVLNLDSIFTLPTLP